MYETIDASKTLLAALMRETSALIGRGEAERSPLENFAHGLKPLLGPWTTRTEPIGANNYQFTGPDVEQSALLEVAHAFASMARYPETAPLVRTLDALIHEHENEATAFDYASLAIDELSDKYEDAKLNGPHEFWDDLLAVGDPHEQAAGHDRGSDPLVRRSARGRPGQAVCHLDALQRRDLVPEQPEREPRRLQQAGRAGVRSSWSSATSPTWA